jgi:hypothetical protein
VVTGGNPGARDFDVWLRSAVDLGCREMANTPDVRSMEPAQTASEFGRIGLTPRCAPHDGVRDRRGIGYAITCAGGLPSQKPRPKSCSDEGTNQYRHTIPDCDGGNRIAVAIECVSGCPESSSEPEISNRVGAPSRSAHIRAANRMAAKDNMQRKQRGEEIWLAPKRHLYPGL